MRIAFLSVAVLASAICHATTFTYNQTVTLNPSLIANEGGGRFDYTQQFSGNPVLQIQTGDVVTGTITFANGSVELTNLAGSSIADLVLFFTPTSGSPSVAAQSTIQFLGLNGTLGTTNPTPLTSLGGCCVTAEYFSNGTAADFSFTGFTYTIDVTSVTGSSQFALTQLSMEGNTVAIGSSATPEPSGAFLLLTGGCVVLLKRWRLTC